MAAQGCGGGEGAVPRSGGVRWMQRALRGVGAGAARSRAAAGLLGRWAVYLGGGGVTQRERGHRRGVMPP